MIGKKTLKDYEFKSIEEYFNYIIDSKINGQITQTKELINKLSKEQKADFINFLKEQEFKFLLNEFVNLLV